MMAKFQTEIKNVEATSITRKCRVKDKEVSITLENVMTGEVNGKRELLDQALVENLLTQVTKVVAGNTSQYISMPESIHIGKQSEDKSQTEVLDCYAPRYDLEQVALSASVREKIKVAISAVKNKEKMVTEWGMDQYFAGKRAVILNFYGKPGTGKSMTAEAVAKALGKKVYQVNYSELESKYVGETPKNIRKAFEIATKEDAVLIFDEADSFLGKRLTSVTQSADYGVNITRSVLLMELEKFTGVVVFTTNLISNYDDAFKRRILLSVYFEMPDAEARKQIWKLHMSDKMPRKEEVTVEALAQRYDDISGADIKDMVFYAALSTLEKDKEALDLEEFDYAYNTIKERYEDKDAMKVKVVSTERITEEQFLKETGAQEEP